MSSSRRSTILGEAPSDVTMMAKPVEKIQKIEVWASGLGTHAQVALLDSPSDITYPGSRRLPPPRINHPQEVLNRTPSALHATTSHFNARKIEMNNHAGIVIKRTIFSIRNMRRALALTANCGRNRNKKHCNQGRICICGPGNKIPHVQLQASQRKSTQTQPQTRP